MARCECPVCRGVRGVGNQSGVQSTAVTAKDCCDCAQLGRPLILRTYRPETSCEGDLGRCQSAGLVGAKDSHRAEVVDRCQAFDDDFALGHPHCSARERHGRNHWQQLGRKAHRQRYRKHERLQHRAAQQNVSGQDQYHQDHGQPCCQQSEGPEIALKRRYLITLCERGCGRAK